MIAISKAEFAERMMRLRHLLKMAWTDVYSLDMIDNQIKQLENNYKIDGHLVDILNHYRKLMQYDLCLSLTKLYYSGNNSLKGILCAAHQYRTGDWGKYLDFSNDKTWEKIKAYRDHYLAHLTYDTPKDSLSYNEMIHFLHPLTDFYNRLCANVDGGADWMLTDNELNKLQFHRFLDFMSILAPLAQERTSEENT